MTHPLGNDVLIELGGFTWAAIELEGYVDTVCSFIRYADPREDRRSIGQKVKDARAKLESWPIDERVASVDDWLVHASSALESRNAVLHSTVLARIGRHRRVGGNALGEMPRRGRPYLERELTLDGIRAVRVELEEAGGGWLDALRLADELHPKTVE